MYEDKFPVIAFDAFPCAVHLAGTIWASPTMSPAQGHHPAPPEVEQQVSTKLRPSTRPPRPIASQQPVAMSRLQPNSAYNPSATQYTTRPATASLRQSSGMLESISMIATPVLGPPGIAELHEQSASSALKVTPSADSAPCSAGDLGPSTLRTLSALLRSSDMAGPLDAGHMLIKVLNTRLDLTAKVAMAKGSHKQFTVTQGNWALHISGRSASPSYPSVQSPLPQQAWSIVRLSVENCRQPLDRPAPSYSFASYG